MNMDLKYNTGILTYHYVYKAEEVNKGDNSNSEPVSVSRLQNGSFLFDFFKTHHLFDSLYCLKFTLYIYIYKIKTHTLSKT